MTFPLRALGYLALGAIPFCYRHVPFLPPYLRSPALLAAGAAFGAAWLLAPDAEQAGRRVGRWVLAFLAWEAASTLWSASGFRWAPAGPGLHGTAALAVAAGIASDPSRRRGLLLVLGGWMLALLLFAFNLLSHGQAEVWTLGDRLQGNPSDHLPFGNRNTAALLVSALIPPAVLLARASWMARRWGGFLAGALASAFLGWLLAKTDALGALLGLLLGGLLTLTLFRPPSRRLLAAAVAAALICAAATGVMLARRPPPPWRLTSTLGLRTLAWESAVRGWRQAPLLGLGAGSFPLRFPEFREPLYPLSQRATPRVLHPYNLPLQLLCETGPVGLLLAGLALAELAGAWRAGRGWLHAGAVWTCGALLGQGLGGDVLGEPLGLACLAVAAGVSLAAASPSPRPASWRRAALALGLLGLAVPAIILQTRQAQAFAQAHLLQEKRAFAAAEAAYREASRGAVPSLLDLDARFFRAACLMELKRPAEALAVYRDLLARGGPYGNARREAARAALLAGDRIQAARWLEGHLGFNPCDVVAMRLLVIAKPEAGAGIESDLRDLVPRVPDTHPMLAEAADWRCQEGDWEGGWRLYRRALAGAPDSPDLQENTLVAGLRAGRAAEALALARGLDPAARQRLRSGMDALIQAFPLRPEPRGTRALLRWADGDRRGAREDLAAIPPGAARWRAPLAELLASPSGTRRAGAPSGAQ